MINAGNEVEKFSLKIHHGGQFSQPPQPMMYVNGNVDFIDNVNSDLFSVVILYDMFLELGYLEDDEVRFHYRVPDEEDLELGLRPLINDSNVLDCIKYTATVKLIEVYIEHISPDYEVLKNRVLNKNTELEDSGEEHEGSDSEDIDYQPVNGEGSEGSESEKNEGSHKGKAKVNDSQNTEEDSNFIVDLDNEIQDYEVDMDEFRAAVDFDVSDDDLGNEKEGNEDEQNEDVEVDLENFDSLSDEDNDTELHRAIRATRKKKKKAKQSGDCPFYLTQTFKNKDEIKALVKTHAVESRRQLMITRNDKVRFRVVCQGVNPKLVRCESNVDKTKDVGPHQVGCSTTRKKKKSNKESEPEQVGTSSTKKQSKPKKEIPQPTCPWEVYITNSNQEGTWVVTTLCKEHKCLQTRDVNLCTISWLAKEVEPMIQINPNHTLGSLQDTIQKKFQVQVTIQQMFRARAIATQRIQGSYGAQYGMLRDYCEELLRSNPGSTIKIDVERAPNPDCPTRQFKRIYICLGALKAGFKLGGRDIMGLDGCFMKGPFPGQILTAVSVDANNGIYPVAYALVESETTSSWMWFLMNLGDDLGLDCNSSFTFISDRQKVSILTIYLYFVFDSLCFAKANICCFLSGYNTSYT